MTASRSARGSKTRHISRMEIEPSANKGLTIRHHYASGPDQPYMEPKAHVFTRDQFHSHVVPHMARHLGVPKGEGGGSAAAGAKTGEPTGADNAGE